VFDATTPPGPVHDPPLCGVPPSLVKRSNAGALLHTVNVPFVPAFGAAFTVTVTVAWSFTHGAEPATV
jgi:hypothetical protein